MAKIDLSLYEDQLKSAIKRVKGEEYHHSHF